MEISSAVDEEDYKSISSDGKKGKDAAKNPNQVSIRSNGS